MLCNLTKDETVCVIVKVSNWTSPFFLSQAHWCLLIVLNNLIHIFVILSSTKTLSGHVWAIHKPNVFEFSWFLLNSRSAPLLFLASIILTHCFVVSPIQGNIPIRIILTWVGVTMNRWANTLNINVPFTEIDWELPQKLI